MAFNPQMALNVFQKAVEAAAKSGKLEALARKVAPVNNAMATAIRGGSATAVAAMRDFATKYPVIAGAVYSTATYFAMDEIGQIFSPAELRTLQQSVEEGDYSATVKQIFTKMVPELLQRMEERVGDGAIDTVWSEPDADMARHADKNLTALRTVQKLVERFGSVDAAEDVYVAFHVLEPEHFALYRTYKKGLRF